MNTLCRATAPLLSLAAALLLPSAVLGGASAALLDPLNEQGIGTFSARVQVLAMERDWERTTPDMRAGSVTAAAKLGYRSPEWNRLQFGAQYVHSSVLAEDDNGAVAGSPAYWLSNSDYNDLTELFARVMLEGVGLAGSDLTVGRQVVNYDFLPTYEIRQKPQAIEAAVLRLRGLGDFSVDLGHIERFSAWPTRTGGTALRGDFVDVEEVIGVSYKTDGVQFLVVEYTGFENVLLRLYDYYGQDLYNNFGLRAAKTFVLSERDELMLSFHGGYQNDVGRMDTDGLGAIDVYALEGYVQWKRDSFSVLAGVLTIGGDMAMGENFYTPFRTSFVIDPTLMWETRQFIGETDSVFAKAVYAKGPWKLILLGVAADHSDNTHDEEVNFIGSYSFENGFYLTTKLAWGEMDGSEDTDIRLFAGFNF